MNALIGLAEQLDVHGLILLGPGIHLLQSLAILLLHVLVALSSIHGAPVTNLGVHGMVSGTAVYADPSDLLILAPLNEAQGRTGMTNHVALLISLGGIPTILMITSVDDEDIALTNFNALLDHLGSVDAEVFAAGSIGQVNNDAGTNQLGQLELINSTAGSIEMQRAIQVGTNMVGVGEDLAVSAVGRQALEELHLYGLIGGPGGAVYADRDRQIINLDIRPLRHSVFPPKYLVYVCGRGRGGSSPDAKTTK